MSAHIDDIYNRVMNVVEESNRMVDAPNVPDMSHIQKEVKTLVDEINALPIEHRVTYADKFGELFTALEELEHKLVAKKDEVSKLISETGQQKKAHQAYAKSFIIDKQNK